MDHGPLPRLDTSAEFMTKDSRVLWYSLPPEGLKYRNIEDAIPAPAQSQDWRLRYWTIIKTTPGAASDNFRKLSNYPFPLSKSRTGVTRPRKYAIMNNVCPKSGQGLRLNRRLVLTQKTRAIDQRCFYVGSAYTTLDQHRNNIGQISEKSSSQGYIISRHTQTGNRLGERKYVPCNHQGGVSVHHQIILQKSDSQFTPGVGSTFCQCRGVSTRIICLTVTRDNSDSGGAF